ncbi:Dopamine D2-like receptor [Aphelenchoides besseyi]|nr:Dopamine D2-like receptor [Aphelenchoides besseyi]
MPGGIGNRTLGLGSSVPTASAPVVPENVGATSSVAEKALNVAATLVNDLMAAAIVGQESTSSTTSTTTPVPTSSFISTAMISTLPPIDELPPVPTQHASVFIYGFCLVMVMTATILGNLLVIISVLRFKALHSAINFLILGLAMADLFVALFVMPYAVYVYVQGGYWFLGPLMCDVYSASDVACSTASILLLAVISFDRYRAVSRPIQYSRQSQNIRRVVVILIAIWLISLALASPIVLGVNYRPPDASPYECRFYNPEFSIGSSIVSFVIPCFIVLFVYIRIMVALRKRERAAKMRRVANTKETNKVGDMTADDNDAGQIVAAPGKLNDRFGYSATARLKWTVEKAYESLDEIAALLRAVNVLMLALPTIQQRMRRFDRHQRAVHEAGDSFGRAFLLQSIYVGLGGGKNKASNSVPARSSVPAISSSTLMPISPTNTRTRRASRAISPASITSATHALTSAFIDGSTPLVVGDSVSNNENGEVPTSGRKCRFSNVEVNEYEVEIDSEDESLESEYSEDEDEELYTSEEDDDFDLLDHRPNSARTFMARVGCGITNAVSVIGARPRLSLAEPSLKRFVPSRKFGVDQAPRSARGSFLGQSTPQALGLSSLMPLLASHESFRRCSDTISQNIRSNSTAGCDTSRSAPTAPSSSFAAENGQLYSGRSQGLLRPFSTSPTSNRFALPSAPRTSPAVLDPESIENLMEDEELKSPTEVFTFSATLSPSATARSELSFPSDRVEANRSDELILNVANIANQTQFVLDSKHSTQNFVLPPAATTTTTLGATTSTPLVSPTTPPPPSLDEQSMASERPSSTARRCRAHRERIWAARERFFRNATDPVLHDHSPLMLRRFVLDVSNDPPRNGRRRKRNVARKSPSAPDLGLAKAKGQHGTHLRARRIATIAADEHDVASSSPMSSSGSLSENLHVITNDFASEAPTSISRKSSELDSANYNHTNESEHPIKSKPSSARDKKSPSVLRNSVRRFKSFHVSPRALVLPSVDVSKATDLFRNISRRSPRLFRPSPTPMSVASFGSAPVQKNMSYTDDMIDNEKAFHGVVRRQSDSITTIVSPKRRNNSMIVHSLSSKPKNEPRQSAPTIVSNVITSRRHPGALTSSTLGELGEELDYVDIDSMHDSQDVRIINRLRQRSPVPYSEETTSSATDVNFTSPLQSIALPPIADENHHALETDDFDANRPFTSTNLPPSALVIRNSTANLTDAIPRKSSRTNGRNANRDDASSPSVTFKIPGSDVRPFRRLSSATNVLETSKLLDRPTISTSQSTMPISDAVSPKTSKASLPGRSFSQKTSVHSNGEVKPPEHSSDFSTSQSQGTTTGAAGRSTPMPPKNLESKLKMVKRAINRKESSLKRKVSFLVCWVPFFALNILNAVCVKFDEPACQVGFGPFFYATCFMNPVIYTIFNTEFRRAFKSLILGRSNARRSRARHV